MSKVEVAKRQTVIPPEYVATLKPGCQSFEQILKIQPLITSFNSQTVPYKIVVEMPNVNYRLNEVYLEAAVTVTFTSNDVKDTYATVEPTICRYATSLINQVRLLAGSTEVSNIRQLNTIYNWQQNVKSNSITRLEETYNNVAPVAYTAATPQTFRFPLSALGNDLWALENGIWPGIATKKCNLECYFESPQYCIYAAGAIEGTVFNFAYSVSGFNVQIVAVSDPNLDRLISTKGICLNYLEWYWYQQAVPLVASHNIQVPIAFSSVRGIVWGIRRVADLTDNTLATKQYLMSSELTDLVTCDLRINSQLRQQDKFVSVEQMIPETRRLFPIAKYSDYWTDLTLNKSTNQMLGMLAGQAYCTSCVSGLDSQRVNSNMYLEFTLTSALSTASVIDIYILHDRAVTVTPGNMYIDE
jgi:hypothetical protein